MKKMLFLLVLVIGLGSLFGATVEYTDDYGFNSAAWTNVQLNLNQFNTALYSGISQVDVYLDFENISTGSATNNETETVDINIGQNTTLTADVPESGTDKQLIASAQSGLLSYTTGETKTFQDGGTNSPLSGSATTQQWTYYYAIPAHKTIIDNYFVGAGTYDIDTDAITQNVFNGDNDHPNINVTLNLSCTAKVTARVVYTYTEPPVPVTLSSLTAAYTTNGAQLMWTTQSEQGNLGFNVYRSATASEEFASQVNGILIEGQGTTSEPFDYIWTDETELTENQTYFYWIEDVTADNVTTMHGPVSITVTQEGGEQSNPNIEQQVNIHNYPNPFNPDTALFFSLKDNEVARSIEIYNVRGQKVRSFNAPVNPTKWDGKDIHGESVSSGIYMYVLKTNQDSYVKKMVLSK